MSCGEWNFSCEDVRCGVFILFGDVVVGVLSRFETLFVMGFGLLKRIDSLGLPHFLFVFYLVAVFPLLVRIFCRSLPLKFG